MGNMGQAPDDSHEQEDGASSGSAKPRLDARTKLDVIYQEVLGEVSQLVGRVERASGKVLKAENLNAAVVAAIQKAHEEAGQQLRRDLANANGQLLSGLREQVQQTKAAAAAMRQAARRMVLVATGIGAAVGLLGGVLGGYFIASGALGRILGG